MDVLILGGSGFIGYHLINALKKINIEPHVVDIRPPLAKGIKYTLFDLHNINRNSSIFKEADAVYHLAWTTLPETSNNDPVADITSNLSMSIKILDACINNGVKKLIFISSGGTVYGIPRTVPINEGHPTNPICSYGITKLMVEKYIQQYCHIYGLDYVIFRPSNPFGEYQNPSGIQGAVTVFLGHLAKGNPITIWGDGNVVRDYFYIGDLVTAMVKALDYFPSATGERVFNVGSGAGMSLNGLINLISRITGIKPMVKHANARALDVDRNVLDISLIKEKLGWFPKKDMDDAIEKTWRWVKENCK